jgi:hypothetical protein
MLMIRASCLAVVQVLDCKCISCDGELYANALLTVIAVTPHTLARRVQTQATSDDFLSHNTQMFRLEFFANTDTAPQVCEFTYYFSHLHLISVISTFLLLVLVVVVVAAAMMVASAAETRPATSSCTRFPSASRSAATFSALAAALFASTSMRVAIAAASGD